MVSTAYKEQRRVMVVTEARQTEDGSAHRMVIAANELSRNGDELNLRGISFKNYRKNPVVLWAHDSYQGIPIAKTLKIGHDDQGRIVQQTSSSTPTTSLRPVWRTPGTGDSYEPPRSGTSPPRWLRCWNEQGRAWTGLRIEESELLEWSLVAVPADPDSVRAAARAMNLPAENIPGL